MKAKTVTQIGHITDAHNNTLLKMWEVSVPEGRRPLTKHQHLNFEIMMAKSGNGVYTTASGNHPIASGDVFIFSSNEWHCITEVGKSGLSITNLQFAPTFIRSGYSSITDMTSALNSNFYFYHSPAFQNRIPAMNTLHLKPLFASIREELETQQQEYALSVKSTLSLLLINLIRHYNYAENENTVNLEQFLTIQQALSYIDDHFTEKITLQELSSLAGLTPNYFCFLFKQVSGLTLSEYINAKRIDKAIQLLATESNLTNIIDIAASCGYNNTANFNKIFKKTTGMTPSAYRANMHTMIS